MPSSIKPGFVDFALPYCPYGLRAFASFSGAMNSESL